MMNAYAAHACPHPLGLVEINHGEDFLSAAVDDDDEPNPYDALQEREEARFLRGTVIRKQSRSQRSGSMTRYQ